MPKAFDLIVLRVWTTLFAWLLLGCGTYAQTVRLAPDTIFYGGKVITGDSDSHIVEAVAVRGDRFVATGSNDAILPLADRHTQKINLRGRTVIPGLTDNHNHQFRSVLMGRGLDLSGIDSVNDLLQLIRQAVARSSPDHVIYTSGLWDLSQFKEKRLPLRSELDELAPKNPVIVKMGRFRATVNTKALEKLGIGAATANPPQGEIVKDRVTGEPTGELLAAAARMAADRLIPPPTEEELIEVALRMEKQENALGVTSIREPGVPPEQMRLYQKLWQENRLTLRVSMALLAEPEDAKHVADELKGWGVGPGFGDHMLRLDCVGELSLDGPESTGLMREPYQNRPNYYGAQSMSSAELNAAVQAINQYGWRPCIHVQGDKGLDLVLDAYEAADRVSSIKGKRWVIEHAILPHPEQIARIKSLGVVISTQARAYLSTDEMIRYWGSTRVNQLVPMRAWLDNNVVVSGGTDWPSFPNNLFNILYFYITRRNIKGDTVGAEQRISREEALRAFTTNNAYLTFEEKVKGSIEPGKLADLAVLDRDFLTVPESEITKSKVLMTVLGGKTVYQSPDF